MLTQNNGKLNMAKIATVANKHKKTSLNKISSKRRAGIFALIFAVLGGGYLVYSTFAATQTDYTYYARNYTLPTRATKVPDKPTNANEVDVVRLSGGDTNARARMTIAPTTPYSGTQRICFHYKVTSQNMKSQQARTAFAVYDQTSATKSLKAVSKESAISKEYASECMTIDLPSSKKLEFAVSVWDGTASFWKVTTSKVAAQTRSVTITANDFSTYGVRTVQTAATTQAGGNRNGKSVTELSKPGSKILVSLKNTALNAKVSFQLGKKYEACIDYSIADNGLNSDLAVYHPVGKGKIDQRNYDSTGSLSNYKTECHIFTYNGGNAEAVSMHYPLYSQSQSNLYKIRVNEIKITQK